MARVFFGTLASEARSAAFYCCALQRGIIIKRFQKPLRIAAAILLGGTALLFAATALLYQSVFGRRFEADARPLALTIADFPGLTAEPATFLSGGETLAGNFYRSSRADSPVDAVLIFCHGFSNGSRDYLAQINFFAQRGFEVLAYDNTGCYGSTGNGVRGMPQAVINLHDVLTALSTEDRFARLQQTPLMLMGHSWGGYAVNAVLAAEDFPQVRAVVSFSAPNKSLDMLLEQGRYLIGGSVSMLKPFIWTVERIKFGTYAGYSALDGVNHTNAHVLALHSVDDPVVSYESSLAVQAPWADNPHARFEVLQGRGHNPGLTEASRAYAEELHRFTKAQAEERPLTPAELEALLSGADKLLLYELDETVLQGISEFLISALS